jgi:hypothetical protein
MSSIWQSSVEMTDTWQATLIVAVGGALHEWQISASTSPIALSVRDGCLLPIERVNAQAPAVRSESSAWLLLPQSATR